MAEIGCLWVGGALSFLEQLCLRSMVAQGAQVTLYTYGEVDGVPEGVTLADAATILAMDAELYHRKSGSPAPLADRFRYRMLKARPGIVWCDTDVLALAPIPAGPYVFGYEAPGRINNAVLAMPQDSALLDDLLAFTEDDHPVPPWLPAERQAELRADPVHVADAGWGVWGPGAVSHFVRARGLSHHAAAEEVFSPVRFRDVRDLILRGRNWRDRITPATRTVHLYGRATRRIVRERFGGRPPRHGFLGQMLHDYEIETEAAPLMPAE